MTDRREASQASPVIYNIPAEMIPRYRGRPVIVRSRDPVELVRRLAEEKELDNVQYLQLLSARVTPESLDNLAGSSPGIPLDIVIDDPAEYPLLYNFAKLRDDHPIRVTIAAKPGFIRAVKLALALHFAVKLNIGQPNDMLIKEMFEALEFYLHRPNVSEPVDFFHSVFLSLYHKEPVNLWMVQEEDPEFFRFVDDQGRETVSPRLAGIDLDKYRRDRLTGDTSPGRFSKHECEVCQFQASCGGYFKWTDRNYDCTGVKTIFGTLSAAVARLKKDLDGAPPPPQRGVLR